MKKKSQHLQLNNDFFQSNDFYKRLMDSLEEYAVFTLDQKGRVKTWNTGAKKILGYEEKEVLGKNYAMFFTPQEDKLGTPKKELINSLMKNRPINEGWRVKKGGEKFWTTGFVFPFKNAKGTVIGYTKIMRDRTERQRLQDNQKQLLEIEQRAHAATRNLLKNEERLNLAQKAGRIGTFEWLIKDNEIIFTPELEALYGMQPGAFKGTYGEWIKRIHTDDVAFFDATLKLAQNTGESNDLEFRITLPDGSVRWMLSKSDVYFDEKKKPFRIIGVNIDITDRKNLEHQKDVFIGIASHELRTPVTSLKLFSNIIINQVRLGQKDQVLESAQIIKSQTNRLMRLVDDLLDVSKIQAGKLELNHQLFDAREFIDAIILETKHFSQSHKIIYKPGNVEKILGDKERIGQVIMNLISNAIKYSPRADSIVIKTSKKGERAFIEVQDFGIGIPKEEQGKIFDRFFRTTDAKDKNISGFGLGLFISSEIVRRHGGELRVKSTPSKGSTFYFSISLKQGHSE
ncbi:MAG: ATP-binding protein [bacterium]|nr:ATP-binding protein [bacterium]